MPSMHNTGRQINKANARFRGIGLILKFVARGAAVYTGLPAQQLIAAKHGL